jgi:parvulin-like peptidyl-prolyl isomerase
VTRKPVLLLAASVLSVFALSGCGDGTVRTGAAATVGDERITDSDLSAVVDRGLKDPAAAQSVGADKAEFARQTLSRLVQHDILVAAAKKAGVSVDGATVDALQDKLDIQLQQQGGGSVEQAAGKAGISKQDLRGNLTDFALRDALADKLTEQLAVPDTILRQGYDANIAQYDQVSSAHILVATKALADTILAQVKADPSQFAALAAKYSTDTGSKAAGGELGFQGKGALVKEFEAAIFSNPAGSLVEVKTQFGYHVIKVGARKTTTFEQAKNELRRTVLSEQRNVAISADLQKTAKSLGIHINPRFGVWDPVAQEVKADVVCPKDAFSSPSPRAGDPAATPAPSESPTANPCP